MELEFNDMSTGYATLAHMLKYGSKVGNTHEVNNMVFHLKNPRNNLALSRTDSKYGISLSYALGELLWYFTGDNKVSFIGQFGSLWSRISDDGETNNSAYGHLIQKKWGFDQLDLMKRILEADPNSRRAVININTPHPEVIETRDEPCTISMQFFVRNNKLDMTTVMRSNDIWYGTPYDVVYFTSLQLILATQLGVELGEYTHFAGSFHVYDANYLELNDVQHSPNGYDETLNFDTLKLYDNAHEIKAKLMDNVAAGADVRKEIVRLAKEMQIIS